MITRPLAPRAAPSERAGASLALPTFMTKPSKKPTTTTAPKTTADNVTTAALETVRGGLLIAIQNGVVD